MRMAATPKPVPSPCIGIAYPAVLQAVPAGGASEQGAGAAPPPPRALAYARRAVRHRFKRRRDEWAETISEWRDRTSSLPRYTPAGRRIAVCPATYSDATCKTCGACAQGRDAVIGFPAHGAWRVVEK